MCTWAVLAGMTIKVLNPVDDESKRLIDWIDGGERCYDLLAHIT